MTAIDDEVRSVAILAGRIMKRYLKYRMGKKLSVGFRVAEDGQASPAIFTYNAYFAAAKCLEFVEKYGYAEVRIWGRRKSTCICFWVPGNESWCFLGEP